MLTLIGDAYDIRSFWRFKGQALLLGISNSVKFGTDGSL